MITLTFRLSESLTTGGLCLNLNYFAVIVVIDVIWFDLPINSFIISVTDYFDETALSPRDVIKEASDVLSLLSGHEGGIRPSVLSGRNPRYSDEDSKSTSTQGSRDRPARYQSFSLLVSDNLTYLKMT